MQRVWSRRRLTQVLDLSLSLPHVHPDPLTPAPHTELGWGVPGGAGGPEHLKRHTEGSTLRFPVRLAQVRSPHQRLCYCLQNASWRTRPSVECGCKGTWLPATAPFLRGFLLEPLVPLTHGGGAYLPHMPKERGFDLTKSGSSVMKSAHGERATRGSATRAGMPPEQEGILRLGLSQARTPGTKSRPTPEATFTGCSRAEKQMTSLRSPTIP